MTTLADVGGEEFPTYELVINNKPCETVRHGLILLNGELKLSENNAGNLCKHKIEPNEVLISCEEQCHSWPLVEGRFKAFIKLCKGSNLIKIQCQGLKKELNICYESILNQRRFVRVVYIKCTDSDGSFDGPDNVDNSLNSALERLQFNALLLQTFMSEEMNNHGFGYQTFRLEETSNGDVMVNVFTSKLTTKQSHDMNGDQLYSYFMKELRNSSLWDVNCKFLAFMSCSHYDPPAVIIPKDIPRYVKAHTALGGGQLGLFGTASLHTWAKDIGGLVNCFTDNRIIDRNKLFDDSGGRGTYWANYSTTLGAALHELGHCFDLMHMPEGIMARGFDNMNQFVLMTSSSSSRDCAPPGRNGNTDNALTSAMGMFTDHRAHWFRSSAVLLHYHKWLNPYTGTHSTINEKHFRPYVNWSHDVKGPIGNCGGGQENQSYFDDVTWHKTRHLSQRGYYIYHSDYINAIVPLVDENQLNEQDICVVYGMIKPQSSLHSFPIEDHEYITCIEIRAGAWIDGIRFHSNMKSSIWFGGHGGDWYQISPPQEGRVIGIFGTFGEYLGSLGIRWDTRKNIDFSSVTTTPSVQSDIGIGLVELRRDEELLQFWEFVHSDVTPYEFHVPESCWGSESSRDELSIMAVDIAGNICRNSFYGYEMFHRDINGAEKGE